MNPNQNQNPQQFQLLQKSQFPKGIIDPIMLAATTVLAKGDIYVSNGTQFVRVSPGNNAEVLTMVNGFPAWAFQSAYSGTVLLAKLTSGGTSGSMTVVNGIITTVTNPT